MANQDGKVAKNDPKLTSTSSSSNSAADWLGLLARIAFTVILLILITWWLSVVAGYLTTVPSVDENGAVVADPYQRSKDILLVILPIVTTALGYWFGAMGKDKAEQRADQAESTAKESEVQTKAVLAAADPKVLEDAQRLFPQAFSGWN